MQRGFVPDQGDNPRGAERWVAGEPAMGFLGSIKLEGKKQHPIQVFRCDKCGFLEFFAPGA